MPAATIPVTLHLTITLPDGVALAPQIAIAPDTWQYTDSRAADPPADAPQPDPQLARMQAAIDLLAAESSQLRALLTEAHAELATLRGAARQPSAVEQPAPVANTAANAAPAPQAESNGHQTESNGHQETNGQANGSASRPTVDKFPITAPQQQAIVLMIGGQTMGEISRELGVSRSTVYNWRKNNHSFREMLYEQHLEIQSSIGAKLDSTCDEAANVMIAAVLSGNYRAARELLKGRGFMDRKTPDPLKLPEPDHPLPARAVERPVEREREPACAAA